MAPKEIVIKRFTRSLTFLKVTILIGLFLVFIPFSRSPIYESIKSIKLPSANPPTRDQWAAATTVAEASQDTGILHLLIPASKRDVNLCKSILSSTILGYPNPVLLNWGGSNTNMAMIPGTLNYLNTLTPQNDADLVIVADGYDVWYQLPPQILIDRYHRINRRANDRLRASLGTETMETEGITQSIVASSQKNCWPGTDADVNCYAVPESTLPRYIYGPQTDTSMKNVSGELYPHQKTRQRWLNGGFLMGPAKEMRALFERANERALADPEQEGEDQGVLARILGQQEYQREKLRLERGGPWKRSITLPPARKTFDAEEGVKYEFGLGLDYSSELSQATKYSERDLDWIAFGNRSSIVSALRGHNITSPHILNASLPLDIAHSPPPFASLAHTYIHPDPHTDTNSTTTPGPSTPWLTTPLWTNLYTATVPALIHHNAHHNNLKSRRQTLWHKMWFQPYTRELVKARLGREADAGMGMGGLVAVDEAGKSWGGGESGGRGFGVWTGEGEWLGWGDVCEDGEEEEVWRDGRGEWVD